LRVFPAGMIYLSSKVRIVYFGFYFVQDPRSKVCRVQGMEQAVSEVFQVQVKKPRSKIWFRSPAGSQKQGVSQKSWESISGDLKMIFGIQVGSHQVVTKAKRKFDSKRLKTNLGSQSSHFLETINIFYRKYFKIYIFLCMSSWWKKFLLQGIIFIFTDYFDYLKKNSVHWYNFCKKS